jgi:hypothetical protein
VKIDIMGWMFMMLVTLFGLAGRWGLEFLLAFRAGKDHVTQSPDEDGGKASPPLNMDQVKEIILKANQELKDAPKQ